MGQNESATTGPAGHAEQTHTEQTEIERKYAVGEALPLPDLIGVGATTGSPVVSAESLDAVQLEATYFDTAEASLARQRIALRRRAGGHDEGWHLKLPAAEGRTELQWPLTADDSVPAEVLAPVRVHVRDHPLTPLARVSTTRRVTNLLDEAGAVVAEVADDTVTATDAREGTVRVWREWEVELGSAAPATADARAAFLDEVEARLLAAGATVSPSVSKLAQAVGRTGLGAPATSETEPHRSGSPAAARVLEGVAELAARVIDLDPAVRADQPDAVHQLRVTVRRLRSILSTHRGLFDPEAVEHLRAALSRFGGVLGEVRELEVRRDWATYALDELESERGIDDPDARRRLVDDTQAEHDEAHARLLTVMSASTYYRLLDSLDGFVGAAPAATDARQTPKKEARRALRRAGKRALARSVKGREARQALGPDIVSAAGTLGALHESRKAARRLRYAAEFSTHGGAGVLGAHAEAVGDAAEELQDALGWHRDAALFAEYMLLTSRRAEAAGESSFTYGVLYQRSLDQARRALNLAEDARRALRSAL